MGRGWSILICEPRLRGLVVVTHPASPSELVGQFFEFLRVRNIPGQPGQFEVLNSGDDDSPLLRDGRKVRLRMDHARCRRLADRAAMRAWRRVVDDGGVMVERHGLAMAKRSHRFSAWGGVVGGIGMFFMPIAQPLFQGRIHWDAATMAVVALAGLPFVAFTLLAASWARSLLRVNVTAIWIDREGIRAELAGGRRCEYARRRIRDCRQTGMIWAVTMDDGTALCMEATWRVGAALARSTARRRGVKRWTLRWLFPPLVVRCCGLLTLGFFGVALAGLRPLLFQSPRLVDNLLIAAGCGVFIFAMVPVVAYKSMRSRRIERADSRRARRRVFSP